MASDPKALAKLHDILEAAFMDVAEAMADSTESHARTLQRCAEIRQRCAEVWLMAGLGEVPELELETKVRNAS